MNSRIVVRNVVRFLGVVLPMVLAIAAGKLLAPHLGTFTTWVQSLGIWGPIAFVAVYTVGVVVMFPVFLLTMAGGAVFGVVRGSLFVMTGAMLGAFCAFLLARYLIRDMVARRIAGNARLVALDRIVGEDGRRLVFFLRLSPAIPFVLSNYALGVTRVRMSDFMTGTLGLAPIVISYAAFGRAAGAVGAATSGKSAMSTPVLVVGIIATLVLGWLMARIAKRAIREAEQNAGVRIDE